MSENANQRSGAALVLAFDSSMFQQAQRCIETIREHCRRAYQLYAVGIDLKGPERDWLRSEGIGLLEDLASVPRYADGPPYATAMTCRPYLPRLFPGHGIYLSIDPDIRFLHPDAFEFYLGGAESRPKAIVICQEADTVYPLLRVAKKANYYFATRYHRIAKVFGQDVATRMQFFLGFNAGLFAMSAQSPGWGHYAKRIERSVSGPFSHFAEQDAMNVAICEDELELVVAPTIMNWLCMNSMPAYDPGSKRFVRPEYPFLPISVLHLNNSNATAWGEAEGTTQYEIYRRAGLTK
jgi:hypothetical protein